MSDPSDPHADQPIAMAGLPLAESRRAVVMLHGRNASPRNILDLVPRLDRPDFSYVAPAAANNTWYPFSFLEQVAKNEPYLASAIGRLERVLADIHGAGIASEQIALLGFSQGACLAAEFAYRSAQRFGGVVLFSGGLIGPPGTTWKSSRSFGGTPVFLGCSDIDAHVPQWRVDESADVFDRMEGVVTKRIYPGMGHLVSDDEIRAAQSLLDQMAESAIV
jgi:phospholipase/carboxylesterase